MTLPTDNPETLESLYARIGQGIADAVPAEWTRAWVSVDRSHDVLSVTGRYITPSTPEEQSFRVPRTLVRLFEQLHSLFLAQAKADFSGATASLSRDGHIEISLRYPETPAA